MTELIETTEQAWDYLIENMLATDEELRLITGINGFTVESLEQLLYYRTGYRDFNQLINEEA